MSEYIIVSAFVTNSTKLKKLEKQWASRDPKHTKQYGRTKKQTSGIDTSSFGGGVFLIDADNLGKGFTKILDSPLATGMAISENDLLFVGSFNKINKISNFKITGEIKNKLFNDIHWLDISSKGNLITTSTGTDSIIEIDLRNGKVVWDWLATENGYTHDPSGNRRTINREKDYSEINTSTPEHVTHANSSIDIGNQKMLVTLFHQGELILLDKKTKNIKVLLNNLSCPHGIRRTREGYSVSNTLKGEIILLDKKFNEERRIKGNFNWLQDAIELKDSSFLAIDSNNYRICKISKKGKILEEFSFKDKPIKFFCFQQIPKKLLKKRLSFIDLIKANS